MALTTRQWRERVGRMLRETLPREARKVITTAAVELESQAKANQRKAGLHRRTGSLFNRTSARAKFGLSTFESEVELRVDVPYANVHEHGAVITPKRSRYLTIPLDAAKTGAGVMRAPARAWPGTHVRRSRSGKLIIFGAQGQPLFLLVDRVRIPARPFVAPAIATIRKSLRDDLVAMLRRGIEEAGRG